MRQNRIVPRRRGLRGLGDNPSMGPYDATTNSWYSQVKQAYWQKIVDFNNAYQQLLDDETAASSDSNLYNQWTDLKGQCDLVKSTLDTVSNTVTSIESGLASVTSDPTTINYSYPAYGLMGLREVVSRGLRGLGALQLVPMAIIAAAVATAVYLTAEVYKFHALLNATPQQAAQATSGTQSNIIGTLTTGLSTTAVWLGIGALAIFVLPEMMKRK